MRDTLPMARRIVYEPPAVGQKISFRRTLAEADTALFIGATWDLNPYHTDEIFAKAGRFRERIVPGLLTASLLTHLGGLWAFVATEMRFEFLAPVYIGQTITAEAEVVEVETERGRVRLAGRCLNEEGREVLRAEISGFPGHFAQEM